MNRRPASLAALMVVVLLTRGMLTSGAAEVETTAASALPINSPDVVDGKATYSLLNGANEGTPGIAEVIANVVPAGAIDDSPGRVDSPLTILPGSTGFKQDDLQVLVGNGESPENEPVQGLGLKFGDGGFEPNGVLNFALDLNKSITTKPELLLVSPAPNLAFAPATVINSVISEVTSAPPPQATPVNNVPEPLSLALWSALAVIGGLARARSRRSRA